LPRLIYNAVATAPDAEGPILFSKLDMKDDNGSLAHGGVVKAHLGTLAYDSNYLSLSCLFLGRGLMGPINADLRGEKRLIRIKKGNSPLREALQDFRTLIQILGKRPT
jgi:hypothetical protein